MSKNHSACNTYGFSWCSSTCPHSLARCCAIASARLIWGINYLILDNWDKLAATAANLRDFQAFPRPRACALHNTSRNACLPSFAWLTTKEKQFFSTLSRSRLLLQLTINPNVKENGTLSRVSFLKTHGRLPCDYQTLTRHILTLKNPTNILDH